MLKYENIPYSAQNSSAHVRKQQIVPCMPLLHVLARLILLPAKRLKIDINASWQQSEINLSVLLKSLRPAIFAQGAIKNEATLNVEIRLVS